MTAEDSSQPQQIDLSPRRVHKALALVLIAVFAYVLAMSLHMRDYFMDDAYIGFRYVDNVISGHGFVFNPPLPVEGVSNIGWLLALLPFAYWFPVTAVAKVLSIVLLLLTVTMTARIVLRFMGARSDYLVVLPIPLLVASQSELLIFSLIGMETALLAAGICVVVLLSFHGERSVVSAIICALLFLVRPECILLFPMAQLFLNGRDWAAWRRQARPLIVFSAMIILITAARWAYFGAALPNTFAAKSARFDEVCVRVLQALVGLNTNIPHPFAGLVALPLLAGGIWALWRQHRRPAAWLSAALAVAFIFGVYARLDWTGMGRYFAPYVPAAVVVMWCGLVAIGRSLLQHRVAPARIDRVLATAAVVFVVAGMAATLMRLKPENIGTYPGTVLTGTSLIEPSLWMRDALPPDAVIATRRIGAVAYYSKKYIFDYKFGLTEPEVAKLVRARGSYLNNPRDDELTDLWLRIKPDYVLESTAVFELILKGTQYTLDDFEIHGLWYRQRRRFPIGNDSEWVLCERIAEPDPGPNGPHPRSSTSER